MPEKFQDKTVFSLFELTKSIQSVVGKAYNSSYWIKAELHKLNHYVHSGHCYPELVEKQGESVIAQMRANLWKGDYERINQKFLSQLKEPLKDGIKILMQATLSFDPVYGLSLRVVDIDPGFTLGDLEQEKKLTIEKLKTEGLFAKNKELKLPLLPKRIAIISVETSKGYADFIQVLNTNDWGYHFSKNLFPSVLQGEKAVDSIISQLYHIKKLQDYFDAVVIIRGGGGDVGLSCYNSYRLCHTIATFPLPVITGIGHATNETVTEMVAFHNAITPTKLAEWLLQKFHDFAVPVNKAQETIATFITKAIERENLRVETTGKILKSEARNIVNSHFSLVHKQTHNLLHATRHKLNGQKSAIATLLFKMSQKTGASIHINQAHLSRYVAILRKDVVPFVNNNRKYLNEKYIVLGKNVKTLTKNKVQHLAMSLKVLRSHAQYLFGFERKQLNHISKNIQNMKPENILKRGFSITLANGKAVKNSDVLHKDDVIQTILYKGEITSLVKTTLNNNNHDK